MKLLSSFVFRVSLAAALAFALNINTAAAAETLRPESIFWRTPAYVGLSAIAVGAVSVGVGARLVAKNGDWYGNTQDFYSTGPAGFLYIGAGVASAMLGAAALDWARLDPESRHTRSARLRRWSLVAVGAGAMAASAGAALVMKANNNARKDGQDNPKLGAHRLIGWPAIVLGSAAALVGIEGLTIDFLRRPGATDQAHSQFGISWQGRF